MTEPHGWVLTVANSWGDFNVSSDALDLMAANVDDSPRDSSCLSSKPMSVTSTRQIIQLLLISDYSFSQLSTPEVTQPADTLCSLQTEILQLKVYISLSQE
jgi:hypothetical protein